MAGDPLRTVRPPSVPDWAQFEAFLARARGYPSSQLEGEPRCNSSGAARIAQRNSGAREILKTGLFGAAGKLNGGTEAASVCRADGGYRYRKRHTAFLRENITLDWLNGQSWQEFETLVGEIFRARGYFVENVGGGGTDGGIRRAKTGKNVCVPMKTRRRFTIFWSM